MKALTPLNLITPTTKARAAVEKRRGDLDDFVQKELGYGSKDALFKALDGTQIDAVALAIDNVMRGGALITGDQTGVGKGRTVAAMIRWALRQGVTPIFITKTPVLFSDMLRDLNDIGAGESVRPFVTNSGQKVRLEDSDGKVLREIKTPGRDTHKQTIMDAANTGQLPAGTNAIFTTYDQIKSDVPPGLHLTKAEAATMKRKRIPRPDGERMRFLRKFSDKAMIILDESHLAGGESDTGWRVTQMLAGKDSRWNETALKPHGTYYTSATYAKTPKNMGVYFQTNVKRAVNSPKELAEIMAKGGVPLQQVLSSMLAEDGQYVRRELDFSGVDFKVRRTDERPDGTHDPAVAAREKKLADSYTEPLREIIGFNKDVLRLGHNVEQGPRG